MLRVLMAVSVVVCLTGCASNGDPGDRGAQVDPPTGSTSEAATWDGTVSTRSPVSDNTTITTTSTVGKRGVVTNADAGFCWVTAISGSFRGMGEFALIGQNASGYFYAKVQSNTSYDGVTGVGPAMSMRCRKFTDFTALANVGSFGTTVWTASGWPPGGGPNYGQGTSNVTAGNMYPWAGVEGRLGSAGNATWMISAMDHGSDTTFARWAYACPLDAGLDCMMWSGGWETSYAGHTWTYTSTGSSASNTQDVTLTAASGKECYIDGVWGYWTSTTSAKVEVQGDGNWHLVTAKGSATLGIGAYAACFPLAQGF